MIMNFQVKCPHCLGWNTFTEYEFNLYNVFQCKECYSVFRISDAVIEYV